MTNLALEDAHIIVASLNIHGHYIDCPICGRPMMTSENPESSAFWSHFFSKKHAAERPVDPTIEDELRPVIRRVSRAAKRAEREAEAAAKKARAEARVAEAKRLKATHTVTGAFLDGIVDEMEGLIAMMEPYFSQANGDASAREKIAEIRAISGEPLEERQ